LTRHELPRAAFLPGDHERPDLPDLVGGEALAFGVDLFNAGFFWEAHEVWEGVWRTVERGNPQGATLRGLLLFAAAVVKQRVGRAGGAASLVAKAMRQFALGQEPLEFEGCHLELAGWPLGFADWLLTGARSPCGPHLIAGLRS
jgi:hypothetical protein